MDFFHSIGFLESKIENKLITNPIDLEVIAQYKATVKNFIHDERESSVAGGNESTVKRRRGRPPKNKGAAGSPTKPVRASSAVQDIEMPPSIAPSEGFAGADMQDEEIVSFSS